MNYNNLITQVEAYFRQQLDSNATGSQLPYRNKQHTENVVAAAKEIANHYKLNDYDFFVVITAAWLHDIGYYVENGEDHE